MTDTDTEFRVHVSEDGRYFFVGRFHEEFCPEADEFEALWDLRPNDFHIIQCTGGKEVVRRSAERYLKAIHG